MEILYPDEGNEQVHRHSSIDQFRGFLSVMKKGGWTPIVFDQLDGINCETIISHPVIISFGGDIGYVFPEAHCTYASDKFVTADKQTIETAVLPSCFGENGDFYEYWTDKRTFINFDGDAGGSSVGVHNQTTLRIGLSYVKADESLPPVE